MAINLTSLTLAVQAVIEGYFPEPGMLFIDQDEERAQPDLIADLVSAVLDLDK